MYRLYRKNDHLWSFFYIIYKFLFYYKTHVVTLMHTVFALDPSIIQVIAL